MMSIQLLSSEDGALSVSLTLKLTGTTSHFAQLRVEDPLTYRDWFEISFLLMHQPASLQVAELLSLEKVNLSWIPEHRRAALQAHTWLFYYAVQAGGV